MYLYLGLAGKSELENVKVDMIVDAIEDIIKPIPQFWHVEKDEKRKVREMLKRKYVVIKINTRK